MKKLAVSLRRLSLACAVAAGVLGMGSSSAIADTAATAKPDVVAANVDASVNPGDDFFTYANGAWLKAHPIPASEANWGIGRAVQDELYAKLRKISEDSAAQKDAASGSDAQKIGDFWSTAMDEALAERNGLTPLKAQLAQIDAVKDAASALDVAFALQPLGVGAFFDFGVFQDEKASEVMAVHAVQGGLGLPERDYYFNTEAGVAKARAAYVVHLANVLKLLGADAKSAAAQAQKVMAFETALAKVSRKLEDLRDPEKNYNKMAPAEFTQKYTPAIVWAERLQGWKLDAPYLIVGQPEFFAGLQAQLKSTPTPVLRDYLRVQLVDSYASALNKAVDDESFSFYGKVLRGQKEQRPRWKRTLDAENRAMGMILGRIFVAEYFPDNTKQRYNAAVEAIRSTYAERIEKLDWMSAATKAKAREKLSAVTKKVGYPDRWKDYASYEVGRDSFLLNIVRGRVWQSDYDIARLGRPVDRLEWEMTPQTYNAYYNPSNNEIVLPAAAFILPGIADAAVDDALVYGYAGATTIGHEITHGFDDGGRQFDERGNLASWWTGEDDAEFNRRARGIVEQFNGYVVAGDLRINGEATQGENIADLGGAVLGWEAFTRTAQYKEGKPIGGFTPAQRYFIGWALGWMIQVRPESLELQVKTDVHAPNHLRVIGPLSNLPAFHEAFGVGPGDAMYRPAEARVRIW